MNSNSVRILLIILIALIVLQYVRAPHLQITDITLFYINGVGITLFRIIMLGIIIWMARVLSSPFREIVLFILFLWIVSLFGGFLFAGLSNIFVLIIILVIFFSLFGLF